MTVLCNINEQRLSALQPQLKPIIDETSFLKSKSQYGAESNQNIWKLCTNTFLLTIRHIKNVNIFKSVKYNCKLMTVEVPKWISDNYQTAVNNRLFVYSLTIKGFYLRLFFAELLALAQNLQFCLSKSFNFFNLSHLLGRDYVSSATDWRLIFLQAINSGQYGHISFYDQHYFFSSLDVARVCVAVRDNGMVTLRWLLYEALLFVVQ